MALICRDVEETIRFYQDFLGFPLVELVENRDEPDRGAAPVPPDRGVGQLTYPNGVAIGRAAEVHTGALGGAG